MSTTWIVADAPMATALVQVLPGAKLRVPESWEAICDSDCVVVYAHGLMRSGSRRASHDGLRWLEDSICDPRLGKSGAPIVVLGFLPPDEAYGERVYLLNNDAGVTYEHLPIALQALPVGGPPKSKLARAVLALEASTHRLQLQNSAYRHDHKNLIAMVRLFLGAVQAGWPRMEDGGDRVRNVLEKLAELERSITAATPPRNPDDLIKRLQTHQAILKHVLDECRGGEVCAEVTRSVTASKYLRAWSWGDGGGSGGRWSAVTPFAEGADVLVIDDLYDTHGLRDVMTALHPNGARVDGVKNWEDAKQCLEAKSYHLVLLDCNLGANQKPGLYRLGALRRFSVDTPVVMMTAYDNAELALWALRAGCNSFYVKQLDDRGDRDSLDYYLRFLDVVRRPDWEPELRQLWRRFLQALSDTSEHTEHVRAAEPYLRYAFYILFSVADGSHWWVRHAIGRLTQEDATVRAARLAVNALDASPLDLREAARRSAGGDALVTTINNARHPNPEASFGVNRALDVLAFALPALPDERTTHKLDDKAKPPVGCRLSLGALTTDTSVDDQGAGASSPALSHYKRSALGAIQVALGQVKDRSEAYRQVQGRVGAGAAGSDVVRAILGSTSPSEPTPVGRIALIDDEWDRNGWHAALEGLLGGTIDAYSSAKEYMDAGGPKRHDLVLLDLWLRPNSDGAPTPEEGIEALRILKQNDPWLPVAVLSAASDTPNALRCVREGALDYWPKWLPGQPDGVVNRYRFYAELLRVRIKQYCMVGQTDLRKHWVSLWEAIDTSRHPESRATRLSRVSGWPGGTRRSHQDRMDDIMSQVVSLIFPAFMIAYNHHVAYHAAPALDAWRTSAVLGVDLGASRGELSSVAAIQCARATEHLALMHLILTNGRYLGRTAWQSQSIEHWHRKTGGAALTVWHWRLKALQGEAPPEDATAVIAKAVEAVRDFFEIARK